MPLARIGLPDGKPADSSAVADVVYEAMVATLNAPKDGRFQVISEPQALIIDPNYLGIERAARGFTCWSEGTCGRVGVHRRNRATRGRSVDR